MDILFLGHIEGIRYTDTAVVVTASERRKGYRTKDGVVVDDELLTYRFIFKPYFKRYISEHFSSGMLVKIKGVMLPYAKDHDGNAVDGYSIIGQTIDMAAYQTTSLRVEKKLIKESGNAQKERPDLDEYNKADF